VAIAEVDAGRLAGLGGMSLDVEQVVTHLEGESDLLPTRGHGLDDRRLRARQVRRGASADREQRRRLAQDDLVVVRYRDRRIAAAAALQRLALGQADARLGPPAHDLGLEARAQREGAAEEEVARDQRVGETEPLQRRGPAAAAR